MNKNIRTTFVHATGKCCTKLDKIKQYTYTPITSPLWIPILLAVNKEYFISLSSFPPARIYVYVYYNMRTIRVYNQKDTGRSAIN